MSRARKILELALSTPIKKIVKVVDTREFIEQGDRFVPLSGTGKVNYCARCGAKHEVHAHVVLQDGAEAIVGVSCMKSDTADIQRKARSMASAATNMKKLEAKIARIEKYWQARADAEMKSAIRMAPKPEKIAEYTWKCGDIVHEFKFLWKQRPDRELEKEMVRMWRTSDFNKELLKIFPGEPPKDRLDLDRLKRQLKKYQRETVS